MYFWGRILGLCVNFRSRVSVLTVIYTHILMLYYQVDDRYPLASTQPSFGAEAYAHFDALSRAPFSPYERKLIKEDHLH